MIVYPFKKNLWKWWKENKEDRKSYYIDSFVGSMDRFIQCGENTSNPLVIVNEDTQISDASEDADNTFNRIGIRPSKCYFIYYKYSKWN